MAIQASNITVAQNPIDTTVTVISFTRTDTNVQVQIQIYIPWATQTTAQNVQQVKTAIQSYLAQANGIAAVNAMASGVTL